MQKCTHCGRIEKAFPEVPLEDFEAVVTVQVTFEVKVNVKAIDRADAAKKLTSKADEDVREMLDGQQVEWMDSSVEKLALDEVGPRTWTEEEDNALKVKPKNVSNEDFADTLPQCTGVDVRDRLEQLKRKAGSSA